MDIGADPPLATLPVGIRSPVRDGWIDENDHMNSAMYITAARDAFRTVLDAVGLDRTRIDRTGQAVVQRETHLRFVRELRRGDVILMRCWVAGIDQRDVHLVAELRQAEAGWMAATIEVLFTCFDRSQRRSVPWPEAMADRLRKLMHAHAATLPANSVSRRVAVRG